MLTLYIALFKADFWDGLADTQSVLFCIIFLFFEIVPLIHKSSMKGHLLFSALQEILFFPGPGIKGRSRIKVISVV